jgi:hypothetical protein
MERADRFPLFVERALVPSFGAPERPGETPSRPSGEGKEPQPAENQSSAGPGLNPPGHRAEITTRRHQLRPRHGHAQRGTITAANFLCGTAAFLAEERFASQDQILAREERNGFALHRRFDLSLCDTGRSCSKSGSLSGHVQDSNADLYVPSDGLAPSVAQNPRIEVYLPTTAVTSISSNIPGIASALMTRKVLAGIGPSL